MVKELHTIFIFISQVKKVRCRQRKFPVKVLKELGFKPKSDLETHVLDAVQAGSWGLPFLIPPLANMEPIPRSASCPVLELILRTVLGGHVKRCVFTCGVVDVPWQNRCAVCSWCGPWIPRTCGFSLVTGQIILAVTNLPSWRVLSSSLKELGNQWDSSWVYQRAGEYFYCYFLNALLSSHKNRAILYLWI